MKSLRFLRKRTQPFLFAAMVSATIRVTLRQLREQLHLQHKYKILDFGVLTPYSFPEFVRCDYCIVLTNVSIWKDRQLLQFIEELKKTNLGKDYKTNVQVLWVWETSKKTEKESKRPMESVWFRFPFSKTRFKCPLMILVLWTNMERKTVITLNLSTDNQLVIEFRPEVYESLIVTF